MRTSTSTQSPFTLWVRSFGMIRIWINGPRSLGSWRIKGTDKSFPRADSSGPLMRHDLSYLGSLIQIRIIPKERTLCFLLLKWNILEYLGISLGLIHACFGKIRVVWRVKLQKILTTHVRKSFIARVIIESNSFGLLLVSFKLPRTTIGEIRHTSLRLTSGFGIMKFQVNSRVKLWVLCSSLCYICSF